MAAPFDVLKKGFAALYLSQEHSDCKLICEPYTFNLHKSVVTSQSDYFKAAFKRGRFSEGNTSTIKLKFVKNDAEDPDNEFYDDPEIVKLMVHYFYHFDYPADAIEVATETGEGSTTSSDKPQNSLLRHVKVFAMAVKYSVDGLRHLAASKFEHETTKGEAWKDDNFAQAISMIYSSTPDEVTELRVLAEKVLHAHFEELQHEDGIEALMYKYPSLMFALLKRKSDTPTPSRDQGFRASRHSPCYRCQRQFEQESPFRGLCVDCFRQGRR